MPNYANTIMYKLINYDCPELLYVGSTTNFIKRKQKHKSDCKTSNTKVYNTIKENGGWESWVMVKISDYPCTSLTEAHMEEDRLMLEMKSNLNTNKAYTSSEYKKEQMKNYYQVNKEQQKEKAKENYQTNREHRMQQHKEYREANKVQIKEYKSEKINCECGCSISRNKIPRHKRTIKHQQLLAQSSV